MRLIDADELIEHVWRDKLDSRELIAEMVDNAPTVKEIPTKIPISIFEQLISKDKAGEKSAEQEPCEDAISRQGEIHCTYTDSEIAKSFIDDVEAVKDLLPKAESEE